MFFVPCHNMFYVVFLISNRCCTIEFVVIWLGFSRSFSRTSSLLVSKDSHTTTNSLLLFFYQRYNVINPRIVRCNSLRRFQISSNIFNKCLIRISVWFWESFVEKNIYLRFQEEEEKKLKVETCLISEREFVLSFIPSSSQMAFK